MISVANHFTCAFLGIRNHPQQKMIQDDSRQRQMTTFAFQFQTDTEVSAFKMQVIWHNFIPKYLYKSFPGSGHLAPVEIALLKDRRIGCKEKDECFSLRYYICTPSLALSLSAFISFPLYTHPDSGSVMFPGHWCETDRHRNHRSKKLRR